MYTPLSLNQLLGKRAFMCSCFRLCSFSEFSRFRYKRLVRSCHGLVGSSGRSTSTTVENNRRLSELSKAGKFNHARQLFVKMPEKDEFTWNIMVSGYANYGRFNEAREMFNKTPFKSCITWNSLISGCCRHQYVHEAFELFLQMQYEAFSPTEYTVGSILSVCSQSGLLSCGKQLHSYAVKTRLEFSSFIITSLVDMYAKCYHILEAERVFNLFTGLKTHVLWTAMLTGYSNNECGCKAMECFRDMRVEAIELNQFTFPSILKACASESALYFGKQVHGCLIRVGSAENVYIQCALVDMYAKCMDLDSAKLLLETANVHDVAAWNSLLVSCVREGFSEEAVLYFQKMRSRGIKFDDITFPTILKCFASQFDIENVKSVHCLGIKTGYENYNPVINALVDAYGKSGNLDCALILFNELPNKDVVSWTSLINVYSDNGFHEKAMKLVFEMRNTGIRTDEILFCNVLRACTELTLLEFGQQMHGILIKTGFGSSVSVNNSLITLYSKCGCIEDAVNVFSSMLERNLISWTSMIIGFAQNGQAIESINVYEKMIHNHINPDLITFIGLLFACSHAGLVDRGRNYFESMERIHGLKPGVQHYACMIDLLGRSGKMTEIKEMLNDMKEKPNASVWKAVLGACRVHRNIELAEVAFKNLLELEPLNAVPYIMLANLYSVIGEWQEASRIRIVMKTKGINKEPGCSWIEIGGEVNTFVSFDRRHRRISEIYLKVDEVIKLIKKAGYKPDLNYALHDMDEEGKEMGLAYHSEKLAVAFGLLVLAPGLPIRIFKNIRVCGDCHNAMKFISKVFDRHVVLRDSNRFHHFTGGKCSCNDYW